jgi:hypothetical protein
MSKNKPFWTDSSFEPKQSFKFKLILSFGNEQNQVLEIPYYYVVSVDKPSFTVGQRTGKLLNEERKFPTNVTWSPVRIVCIDTVDNLLLSYLSTFLNKENDQNSFRIDEWGALSFQKSPTKTAIKLDQVVIQQLKNEDSFLQGGSTQNIEEWTLHEPWIATFDSSQVSYSNESLNTYTFTIIYDWATLELNGVIPGEQQVANRTTPAAERAAEATGVRQQGRPTPLNIEVDDNFFQPDKRSTDAYDANLSRNRGDKYRSNLQRRRLLPRAYELGDSMTAGTIQTDSTGRTTTDPLER